jgi:ornithine--oxo-acid transaminase
VLSNKEVMDVLRPGEHGSTFGGNPLACAVARAAIRVLIEEDMIGNAAAMGVYLRDSLADIHANVIRDIRGRGLMVAVELQPDAGGARRYCEALMRRGVLCKETHGHTLRIMPPLIITRDQIDEAMVQFRAVFSGSAM